MKKYFYKNIVIVPYYTGYKVMYKHDNGQLEKLTFQMTKKDAIQAGKMNVDYMNKYK